MCLLILMHQALASSRVCGAAILAPIQQSAADSIVGIIIIYYCLLLCCLYTASSMALALHEASIMALALHEASSMASLPRICGMNALYLLNLSFFLTIFLVASYILHFLGVLSEIILTSFPLQHFVYLFFQF